jgi:hypothetical protein
MTLNNLTAPIIYIRWSIWKNIYISNWIENIQNSSKEHLFAISWWEVLNAKPWTKLWYCPASATSIYTVWNVAADYVFPTTAMWMEIVSSSANDTSDWTWIKTVKIYYLDSNFEEKTEIITLNWVTAVPTVALDIFRINWFRAITVGTTWYAEWTISLRHLSDTPIYSQITIWQTRARSFVYTVPKNYVLYITNISFSAWAAAAWKRVTFSTKASFNNLDWVITDGGFFQTYSEVVLMDSAINIELTMPTKFSTWTDLKITVQWEAGAICTCWARWWLETV